MQELQRRFAVAHEKFRVSYEELAEASPYAAYTIERYLSGKVNLGPETEARFVEAVNEALDRIIEERAKLARKV